MGRYRMRSLTLRGNLQRSVAEHAAILRAARRGDAERAQAQIDFGADVGAKWLLLRYAPVEKL